MLFDPTTFEEALSKAEKIETNNALLLGCKKPILNSGINVLQEEVDKRQSRISKLGSQQIIAENEERFLDQLSELLDKNFSELLNEKGSLKPFMPQRTQFREQVNFQGNQRCHFCGGLGHFALVCRFRSRAVNRNNYLDNQRTANNGQFYNQASSFYNRVPPPHAADIIRARVTQELEVII